MTHEGGSWGDGIALMEACVHEAEAQLEKLDRKKLGSDRGANLMTVLEHAKWAIKAAAEEGKASEAIFAAFSVCDRIDILQLPRVEAFFQQQSRRTGAENSAKVRRENAESRKADVWKVADRLRRAGVPRDEWSHTIHKQKDIPLRTVQRDLKDYERATR